jgi:hypothetical protein
VSVCGKGKGGFLDFIDVFKRKGGMPIGTIRLLFLEVM